MAVYAMLIVYVLVSLYANCVLALQVQGTPVASFANASGVNVTVIIVGYNGEDLSQHLVDAWKLNIGNLTKTCPSVRCTINLTSYGVYNVTIEYLKVLVFKSPVNISNSTTIKLRVNITKVEVKLYTNDTMPLQLDNFSGYFDVNGFQVPFDKNTPVYLPFGTFRYFVSFSNINRTGSFTVDGRSTRLDIVLPIISSAEIVFRTLDNESPEGFNASLTLRYGERIVLKEGPPLRDKYSLSYPLAGLYHLRVDYRGQTVYEGDFTIDKNNRRVELKIGVFRRVEIRVLTADNRPLYSDDISFEVVSPLNDRMKVTPNQDGYFSLEFCPYNWRYTLRVKSNTLGEVFTYDFYVKSPSVEVQTELVSTYLRVSPGGSAKLPGNLSVTLYYISSSPIVVKVVSLSRVVDQVNEPVGFLPIRGRYRVVVEYAGYRWTTDFDSVAHGILVVTVPLFDVRISAVDLDGNPLYGCIVALRVGQPSRLVFRDQLRNGQAFFSFVPSDYGSLSVNCSGLEVLSASILPKEIEAGSINVTARVKTFLVTVKGWFNRALTGANVTLEVKYKGTVLTFSTTTDSTGTAVLRNVPLPLGSNVTLTVSYGGFSEVRNVYEGSPRQEVFLDVFLDTPFLKAGLYQTVLLLATIVFVAAASFVVARRVARIATFRSMFEEGGYFEEEKEGFLERLKKLFGKKEEKEEEEESLDIFV